MRVFMPFLVQQNTQTALSHILLAFYNCLPALGRPTSSGAASGESHSSSSHPCCLPEPTLFFFPLSCCASADLFWSAQDAARLGALVAGANDTLAQAQTLITAMVCITHYASPLNKRVCA
jgi:hypothetical protein